MYRNGNYNNGYGSQSGGISFQSDLKKYNPKLFIGLGIFLIIFISIFAYIMFFVTNLFSDAGYVETTGVIVDYATYYDDDGTRMYRPIAEYEVDGQLYTISSNESSNVPKPLGTEVTIQYQKDNPKIARFKTSTLTKVFLVGIVAIFGIIGCVFLFTGIKQLKMGPPNYEINTSDPNFREKPPIEQNYEKSLAQQTIKCNYCGCNNPADQTRCSNCSAALNERNKF